MSETKLFNKKQCPECGYKKEIRRDICVDPDKRIIYYRCKDCGFQWDEGGII